MAQKTLFLLTKNPLKVKEYQHFFSNYNIAIQQLHDFGDCSSPQELLVSYQHLFEQKNTLAVTLDWTQIREVDTGKLLSPIQKKDDGKLIDVQTNFYYLNRQGFQTIASKKHPGLIDYSARTSTEGVYGWDDIIILRPLGISYHALQQRGLKNHGRQEVLSIFVQKHLYLEAPKTLQFHTLEQTKVIEFSLTSLQFIQKHPLLNTPLVKEKQLDRLFNYALGNGGFFRAAQNRRQKNYWTPGLNAGIPLVPKKDAIHEITFLVHDLCHFVLPDLIYSGEQEALYDKIYIIHRMLSEAISLVLADMLFVETLEQAGVVYDYNKRKIYPLYQAIKRKNPQVTTEEILNANIAYCLLGDDQPYRHLIAAKDEKYLLAFQEKYERFFKEDYKWTSKNLQGMKKNAPYFKAWFQANQVAFQQQGLTSIAQFTKEQLALSPTDNIPYQQLVHVVSRPVLHHYQQVLQTKKQESNVQKLSNSFKKYLLGQSFIFYKIDFYSYSQFLAPKFKKAIEEQHFDVLLIQRYRQLYTNYLESLAAVDLLHQDDVITYKEVYPIFDSFYVFYDNQQAALNTLQAVAKHILE